MDFFRRFYLNIIFPNKAKNSFRVLNLQRDGCMSRHNQLAQNENKRQNKLHVNHIRKFTVETKTCFTVGMKFK